jgi:DNA-binding SARP family transcriptional activator
MVLGPLCIQPAEGAAIQIGPPLQRRVLATLILSAGVRRTSSWLAEAVWGQQPPRNPGGALRTAMRDLRLSLGDCQARRLESPRRGLSYMFRAAPCEVDALRFDELAAAGREAWYADDFNAAAELLGAAVRLWREPALADIPDTEALEGVRGILLRSLADVEDLWTDAILALGGHRETIGFLRRVVARDPLREHAWGNLMLALYLDGRPREALGEFAKAEAAMRHRLGCEPGPWLTGIHDQIDSGTVPLTAGRRTAVARAAPGPAGARRFN